MNHETDWPTLCELRLHPDDVDSRRQFIGGSDANVILSGDREKVRNLWLEKRGEKEPADLSEVLPVLLGCWTEPFNRQWFQQLTGRRVSHIGEVRVCGVNS